MSKIILGIVLLLAVPSLSGCAIGLLAAGVGYGVGQGRKGTAAQMDAKAKWLDRYNTYKLGMEDINYKREVAKLEPRPVEDFPTWLNEQPLTPEEQNLFRKYKTQTPNEIRNAAPQQQQAQQVTGQNQGSVNSTTQNQGNLQSTNSTK